jgi:hypothetical protein
VERDFCGILYSMKRRVSAFGVNLLCTFVQDLVEAKIKTRHLIGDILAQILGVKVGRVNFKLVSSFLFSVFLSCLFHTWQNTTMERKGKERTAGAPDRGRKESDPTRIHRHGLLQTPGGAKQ